jgi:radial spoke head protein 4A
LPAVGPDHINVSRLVKHALTGDLESDVRTLPPFPGKEKHFLKAQLTRILFNCEIAPTGCFKTVDEKGK